MADETTQADAAALVAMTVADLAEHLDGVDLPTLEAALTAEKAGFNRKGALAALEAAIAGHPELAKAAAADADAAEAIADTTAPAEDAVPSEGASAVPQADSAATEGERDANDTPADASVAEINEDDAPAPDEDAAAPVEEDTPEDGDEAVLSGPAAPWTATHFLMVHPDGGTSDAFEIDEATGALLVPIGREGELSPHGFVVSGETKIEA